MIGALRTPEQQTVTVFGGSGFLGRYVVSRLAERGYRVLVPTRQPNLWNFLPLGRVGQINPIHANLRNEASVAHAVARADHVVNLVGILQEIFLTNTRDHWIALCDTNDLPACRVNDLKSLFEMDQLKAIGSVADWQHPTEGPFRTMNVVFHMSETPGSLRIPPPGLAEHTDEVLRALGKSDEEIAKLRESGACG